MQRGIYTHGPIGNVDLSYKHKSSFLLQAKGGYWGGGAALPPPDGFRGRRRPPPLPYDFEAKNVLNLIKVFPI